MLVATTRNIVARGCYLYDFYCISAVMVALMGQRSSATLLVADSTVAQCAWP